MKPVNAIITEVVEETPTIRTFFFETSFNPEPGQFVLVWIRGVDEIPMALSYNNAIFISILHGIDVFFTVDLPDIFLFCHPLCTVLGRAQYSDYFLV